jgi:hypothetical protein
MRRPQAKCKRCSNAHRAQWARENKAKTQAARKRYWQHVRERMATDPEFAAEYREEKHFYNADYRRRCGKKPRPRRSSRSPRVLVDAGPFAEWLRARDGGDAVEIAKGVGTWAVTVRNIMDGKVSRVKISTVDAALTFAGEPHRLDELYPLNG